jgi:hypothetical protein
MAQRHYPIDMQDASFPMLSEQQTRTIIGATAREAPTSEGSPGVAYCHNVIPSRYGYDSVGFLSVIEASSDLPNGLTFSDVRIVYGSAKSKLYLAWDTEGNVYALLEGATTWIALAATSPSTGGSNFSAESVTIGTVNGVSYIHYSTIGTFNYDELNNTLDSVTLTGLDISTVLGVVASSGYLIAYTTQANAWSSTIDPTDFIPSEVTGAGGGNVAGIAGAIIFATSNTLGIFIHTAGNTLAGTYTGNTQFPFKFREVEGSEGGLSLDKVAYESNGAFQYIYSKAGMQQLNSQRAEIIIPEVTDFLAGKRFEDYNETTNLYEITDLPTGTTMLKKIKYVASRYLIISYGITSFTHALVYDIGLKKLGKLRIDHTDCFEYVGEQDEVSKEAVAFLLPTGEVKVLDFSVTAESAGVLILGKIQFIHGRLVTLLGVELENIQTGSELTVSDQASLNGKTFTVVSSELRNSDENIREYAFRADAKNHSIVLIGKFNLTTALVRYRVSARR